MIGYLLAALIVVLLALMAIRSVRVARLYRFSQRPEDIERVRAELMAFMKRQDEGVVDLAAFYAHHPEFKDADRYAVQHSLYRADILRPADGGNPVANWLFAPIGRHVVLNRGERNPW